MKIVPALIAALLCSLVAPVSAAPDAAVTPAVASPSPEASPTADALDQPIDLDGLPVTIHDLVGLLAGVVTVYTPAKAKHPSSVLVTKPQSEMPSYDPDWHYVSWTTNAFGDPEITIWQSERLGGKAPFDLMASTAIVGLLDAGYGGAHLQALYGRSRAADVALGSTASNPWKNRRELGDRLAQMLDTLMESLKH